MVNKPAAGRPADPAKDRDILAAGRALLFQRGPQAVTMEAVARLAGVSKPTLYRRWPNRDALLAAVALAEAEAAAGRLEVAPSTREDLRQALTDFSLHLLRFLLSEEHVRFIHALGAATGLARSSRESIFRNGPMAAHGRLAAWLERGDRRGLLDCPDAGFSAELFLGALMGLDLVRTLYHVREAPSDEQLRDRVEHTVGAFLRLHEPAAESG